MSRICFENLGEEYPKVLAMILMALWNIVVCLWVENIEPPIEELLPSLTPILKNRNDEV